MSKTKRRIGTLMAVLLIAAMFVCCLPVSADTMIGDMETNVPDTDIGGATGGADIVTGDLTPETNLPDTETSTPATDTVTTPVTSVPETTDNGAVDDTADDGLGWLGIVICVAVVAAIIIVVVALLPKKKDQ